MVVVFLEVVLVVVLEVVQVVLVELLLKEFVKELAGGPCKVLIRAL